MATMDSLKDENVEEILLRLPSSASLGHAVRASGRLRRVASNPGFLRRFRARHASSSPHSFLGVFGRRQPYGLPGFHLAGPARSDPGLVAVARTGDFLLACLEDDPGWRLRDCRNGRLLLSRGRSLSVHDPISLRRIDIDRPADDPFPNGHIADASCLVANDGGDASFRVVSLQVDDRRRLRAVEYDSRAHGWRFHPWAADAITITPHPDFQTMYAAGRMFWNKDGVAGASSLVLDTSTMEFSMLPLPANLPEAYSIGETEDGECCLVCIQDHQLLQVWLLKENNWVLEKEKPSMETLGEFCEQQHVRKVVAGLVFVYAGNVNYSQPFHHYAIDIKNLSLKAKIYVPGAVIHPFILPWPPAGLKSDLLISESH